MTRTASVLALAAVALSSSIGFGQTMHPWDVGIVPQPGQLTAYMRIPFGGDCGLPVELGDYDDDGIPDYAASPLMADGGPLGTRTESGEVTVFKGTGTISGIIDLQNPPPGQPLLTVYGAASFDYVGTEMFSADVTGDGITDLILGAMGADPAGRDRAGAVYVIPGGSSFGGVIDLANPPASVIQLLGRDSNDRLGIWVEAGDVNGDGVDDLLMGADGGDGVNNNHSNRGEVVIVFGGQTFPSVIDFANPPAGLQFTVVHGLDNGDHFGTCIYSTDLDDDGIEDLIAAAAINRAGAVNTGVAIAGGDGPNNNRTRAGETYVFWGRSVWPAIIDVANPDAFTAANLTTVWGADPNDVLGEELTSANLDGDAYDDLVLGALTADGLNNQLSNAGGAVVIWGGPQLRGASFDMALLPAGTVTIHGMTFGEITADTMAGADVNKDGIDDLLLAAPSRTVIKPGIGSVSAAGALDVIFGNPVRFPTEMVLGSLGTDFPSRQIWGAEAGDLLGYSLEAGDMDGDGFADIFPNSMRGDGFNNSVTNAGDVNLVSGRIFCRGLTTLTVRPRGHPSRNDNPT